MGAWHLVASADDRARSEQMGRLKLKEQTAISSGVPPEGWSSGKPWTAILTMLLQDEPFWQEQLHQPALTWMARGMRGRPLTPMDSYLQAIPPPPRPSEAAKGGLLQEELEKPRGNLVRGHLLLRRGGQSHPGRQRQVPLPVQGYPQGGMAPLKDLRKAAGKAAWMAGILPRTEVGGASPLRCPPRQAQGNRRWHEGPMPQSTQGPKVEGRTVLRRAANKVHLWLLVAMQPYKYVRLRVEDDTKVTITTDASPLGIGGVLAVLGS